MDNENESKSSSANEAKEFPEVAAFEDEFTRSFLESTETTREGYYSFVSKSNSFKMDFPQDMIINEESHTVEPDDRGEYIYMEYNPEGSKDLYAVRTIQYTNFMTDEANSKKQISNSLDLELEFNEISLNNDQKLQLADFEYDEEISGIAALISNSKNQELQIIADIQCGESTQSDTCTSKKEKEKEKIMEWLETIEFINTEGR
ncbi:hypothetical protein [Terribacillus saccharophilus]|uniref:Uncharacterized protein n=2 Tax=Terribacillus saccharophilus TaxID=361277 RepID=A0A268AAL5_9BACI|nr:hypothetical protein [Terribacillus saccharophilus]PAD21164.1 hypothetical protein CHH64_09515 [Terribacillus saccharophilus]PAF36191.1 hypothetical protein CHH58_13470 [Terribacillus saccharophilus]